MVLGEVGRIDTVRRCTLGSLIHIWQNIAKYDKQIYVYGQFFGSVTAVVLVDLVANLCHESLGYLHKGSSRGLILSLTN
jgi:hypothetical protein